MEAQVALGCHADANARVDRREGSDWGELTVTEELIRDSINPYLPWGATAVRVAIWLGFGHTVHWHISCRTVGFIRGSFLEGATHVPESELSVEGQSNSGAPRTALTGKLPALMDLGWPSRTLPQVSQVHLVIFPPQNRTYPLAVSRGFWAAEGFNRRVRRRR